MAKREHKATGLDTTDMKEYHKQYDRERRAKTAAKKLLMNNGMEESEAISTVEQAGKLLINSEDVPLKNAMMVTHVKHILEISMKVNRDDPESMLRGFWEYITYCEEYNYKVSNLQAYASMGIGRPEASRILQGKMYGRDPRYAQLIRTVNNVCAMYREGMMLEGAINPVVGIFWQKSLDNYIDQPKTEIENDNPNGEVKTAEEIAEKYADIDD